MDWLDRFFYVVREKAPWIFTVAEKMGRAATWLIFRGRIIRAVKAGR